MHSARFKDSPRGFRLVALSLVGGRDDREHGVNAAIDRIGVDEVTDRLVVVRLLEKFLPAEKHRVRTIVVATTHLRLVAAGGIVARLLGKGGCRYESADEA